MASPVAEAADRVFLNFAEDDSSSESFYIQSLGLALSVLIYRKEWPEAQDALADLAALPDALLAIKSAADERAEEVAQAIARFRTTSSPGPALAGRRPIITGCASWKRCSGSNPAGARGRLLPRHTRAG